METSNLTEKQQLRVALADKLGYDLSKAKAAYDFIINYDKPSITQPQVAKPDGVYYVMEDRSLIPANEETAATYRDAVIGVAVKMGDKVATVALHDVAGGEEIPLADTGSGSESFYHPDFWDAITDWDGEGNTKDLGSDLNSAIQLKEGDYIPSLAQLHLILLNIKEVNQALEAVGGTPLRKEWYWTSTEYSSYSAWYVNFNGGLSNGSLKSNGLVVRPAVACQL